MPEPKPPLFYSMDDVMTMQQVADKLHIKLRTVREWVYRRTIPYTKLGRRIYVARSVIEEMLQKNSVPQLPQPRVYYRGMRKKTRERLMGTLGGQ